MDGIHKLPSTVGRILSWEGESLKAESEKRGLFMSNHRFILILVLAVLISASMPVSASRILSVPTADVKDDTLDFSFLYHRGVSSLEALYGFYPGLSAGLRQEFGGSLFAVLRAAVVEETQSLPGFALGGELSVKQPNLYAVVSKQLGMPGLRGHLALGSGRYARGMAGVSFMLNPVQVGNAPTASLFVEYDGIGVNGGLTAQFSPELKANLGMSSGHGLSFGVSFRAAF
jgi:hypothetical protein